MTHFVEIRSYNLKPGTRDEFHRLFLGEAFPMLQRWKVDVVAYGPSLHDQDSYYLMRRFDSLAQREESENAFYGSDEWKQGPREAIIALIESRFAQRSCLRWMNPRCRGCEKFGSNIKPTGTLPVGFIVRVARNAMNAYTHLRDNFLVWKWVWSGSHILYRYKENHSQLRHPGSQRPAPER
jgi:hypothetical protein